MVAGAALLLKLLYRCEAVLSGRQRCLPAQSSVAAGAGAGGRDGRLRKGLPLLRAACYVLLRLYGRRSAGMSVHSAAGRAGE
jgi:hypothetical protein